jgi:hypothetical protein
MSGFHVFKFRFWDPVGTVVELIDSWKPATYQTEKDYEDSLYEYLRAALPGIVITPQYAFGRARTDLAIANKVAIEIKKDLNETSEFQRLLGQIMQFNDWKGYFVVLLVGSTNPNLLDELRKQTKSIPSPFIDPKVVVAEKPS